MADFASYNNVYQVKINPYIPKRAKKSAEQTTDDSQKPSQSKKPVLQKEKDSSLKGKNKTAIDYKSNKVNITDVIKDFKNTITAIGADEKLEKKILGYLELTEIESKESKPSPQIIRTNLKNASKIVDKYISETLNKDSRVVSDWINALLSQDVDYKAAQRAVKPVKELQQSVDEIPEATKTVESLVEIPVQKAEQRIEIVKPEKTEHPANNPVVIDQSQKKITKKAISPELQQIKNLYKTSQKHFVFGEFDKAISVSRKALNIADQTGNKKAKALIHLNMGNIYEKDNNLTLALKNYNQAVKAVPFKGNKKVLAEAHYKMADIYSKAGKDNVAIPHYYKALAHDGELDNTKRQAQTLQNIGDILAKNEKYKKSLSYYKEAYSFAKQVKDVQSQATVLNKIGKVFKVVNQDNQALKYYLKSSKIALKADYKPVYAQSFEDIADIIVEKGQTKKAYSLYKESFKTLQQLRDKVSASRVYSKIKALSVY